MKRSAVSVRSKRPAAAPAPHGARGAARMHVVLAWLARFALPLALCFIAVGALRIVSTYRQLSITKDEPYHFRYGLEYLAEHTRGKTEQPPLAQAVAALPAFLEGARPSPEPDDHRLLRKLLLNSPDPWRFIVRMRAGELPFFIAASLAVFFAARRYFGPAAGAASTALFTLTPPVLAHAGLATTDMAVTAALPVAFFTLTWWYESPGWRRSALLGLALAALLLSKFSGLVYLPCAVALACAGYVLLHHMSAAEVLASTRERAAGCALAAGICAAVVWAGYWFSIGPVPGTAIPLPAPDFFSGIHAVAAHNAEGHPSYLLGEHRLTGWWYFFPLALAVKTPIALLLLAAAGAFACWGLRREGGPLPIALCLGVLLPAMASHMNLGIRHILPIYCGMAVLGGVGLVRLARWSAVGTVAGLALLGWMAVSGARAHPDYIGYFNEFAGDEPQSILLDSDLDWEQDYVLLARRVHQLGIHKLWFDFRNPDFATSEFMERIYGFPEIEPGNGAPVPGWHAESLNELYLAPGGGGFHAADPNLRGMFPARNPPWYQQLRPVERTGGDVLYLIPPDFVQ